jgi:cholesterol oxidase
MVLTPPRKESNPVMLHCPFVPAGAPGELRLDAKKSDIIPEYPYPAIQ